MASLRVFLTEDLIHIERIFADHYQFYTYDSTYNHFDDDLLDWQSNNKFDYGYIATDRAIYVSTVADLNDHRLRIFKSKNPNVNNYERVFKYTLNITSSKLTVSTPINTEEDDIIIPVNKDKYQIFVCSNSIGKDFFSYDGKYDEEYIKHDVFEYYDVYLIE